MHACSLFTCPDDLDHLDSPCDAIVMESVEHAPSPSPVTNADDDYATTDASVDQHSSNDVSNSPAGSPVRKRPRAADDEADESCAANSLFTLLTDMCFSRF